MPSPAPDRASPSPLRILLVAHTHWDREWYHPAARFRQRLIPLVDALLDGSEHAGMPFLLDGQAIVLDDYARVRPERTVDLARALRSGMLEAGPWFVLADNLIPGGEAILRNLEAGRRALERHGARPPAVAYCPDSFGHPAALPMIAAGYGFPLAIVWRGFGGASSVGSGGGAAAEDAFWWHGPDGSRVLVHHLPPDGYETGSSLPRDPVHANEFWGRTERLLRERNRSGVTLLPSGADHHAAQTGLAAAMLAGTECLKDRAATLVRVTLSDAATALEKAAHLAEAEGVTLPRIDGELRDSYGYTWTLQGTFATRAHQKRANARLERLLLSDVEPWLVLAALHGRTTEMHDGRIGAGHTRALLSHAWETLLTTHPHDTLCGCSIDAVARDLESAQESVRSQATGLRAAALESALRHDVVTARARRPDDRMVAVRNRVAYARGGVAELRVADTIGDVPVGPGSAGAPAASANGMTVLPVLGGHPLQLESAGVRHARRESPQHYPDDDVVLETRVVAWLPAVPAHGVFLIDRYGADDRNSATPGQLASVAPDRAFDPVTLEEGNGSVRISNGIVELQVGPDGVQIRHGDRVLPSALSIETTRDHGDSYTASLRGAPARLTLRSVRALARGPLRASVVLEWEREEAARVDAPGDLERHGAREAAAHPGAQSDRPAAPARRARVRVRTTLVIDAASEVIRCDVVVRNAMRDHRLMLSWHADTAPDSVVRADVAFGYVDRTAPAPAERQDSRSASESVNTLAEVRPTTMPMHRWVCAADSQQGATMLSDGLAEAEVRDGRLAITLVRAIGELSRGDLPERPGHAGWPAAIPAAQCLGVYRARLGLMLHDAWSERTLEVIERAADSLLLPLTGESWRDLATDVHEVAGPALIGEGLRSTAVTTSRDARGLILRVRNLSDEPREGAWIMPVAGPWRVTECRLDETPVGMSRDVDSRAAFTVGPRGVLTLRVERAVG